MQERHFQRKLVARLRALGYVVVKNGGIGTPNGFPDLLVIDPDENFVTFLEVKTRNVFQPNQIFWLEKLNKYDAQIVNPANYDRVIGWLAERKGK